MRCRARPASLKPFLFVTMLLISMNHVCSHSPSLHQTQTKLKTLRQHIHRLKQTLEHAHDKRSTLQEELAITEKKISKTIRELHALQGSIQTKYETITSLHQRTKNLNQQLIAQRQLLTKHISTCYKMGEYQPVKWLLNQNEPYTMSRLLTFYQYLIRSRQHAIAQVKATKQTIALSQNALETELTRLEQLQQSLKTHQQQLNRNKSYHQVILQSLNQEIQTKEHTLKEYEYNKNNLSNIISNLATQSRIPNAAWRHQKLPYPIQKAGQTFQKMNQGLTFFAAEGTPVTAVYPGKVVFSDWLRGYGLLLIIDHGQGFMTLYAHNQSLLKQTGDSVSQNEQIASVGHSGGLKQNGLYFEVRQHGKAISPLAWLASSGKLMS